METSHRESEMNLCSKKIEEEKEGNNNRLLNAFLNFQSSMNIGFRLIFRIINDYVL